MVNSGEIKKAKGGNKNFVESIRHKEYVDVLFNRGLIRHKTKIIQSKLHRIWNYDVFKILLLRFNEKSYILDIGVNILACFHRNILL